MAYIVYDLQDTYDRIQEEKQIVIDQNCYFGAKVVRGAYLERERFLAAEQGYEDPINPTYESTGEMYNRVIDHMIDYLCSNDGKEGGHVVIATHNEVNRANTNSELFLQILIKIQMDQSYLIDFYFPFVGWCLACDAINTKEIIRPFRRKDCFWADLWHGGATVDSSRQVLNIIKSQSSQFIILG